MSKEVGHGWVEASEGSCVGADGGSRRASGVGADGAAVAEFVERYNQCWRLEKLAYRTPLEAREEYELRHAA